MFVIDYSCSITKPAVAVVLFPNYTETVISFIILQITTNNPNLPLIHELA